MSCNRTIEKNVNEELFFEEIEKTKKCLAKVLNIDVKNIIEVADEDVFATIDSREKTFCKRKIYNFEQGSIDCYMSKDLKFIEIFCHPNTE